MSTSSAGQAKKMGYSKVSVYLEGEPAWSKAGYPVYASNKQVAEGNIVLIDLRDAKNVAAGHIARAVSIPAAGLKAKAEEIPAKAPVVLYGDNEAQAMAAAKLLKDEGIKKISLVEGGLEGWKKNGGQLVKGAAASKVVWKRKQGKGEVALADFQKAAAGQDPNAIIVDVRAKSETADGKLKNSVAIPMDEIAKRAGELPKGKKVYTHCVTGARAEIGAKELKKHGFDVYFLVSDVECKGENCTFSE